MVIVTWVRVFLPPFHDGRNCFEAYSKHLNFQLQTYAVESELNLYFGFFTSSDIEFACNVLNLNVTFVNLF